MLGRPVEKPFSRGPITTHSVGAELETRGMGHEEGVPLTIH